MPVSTESNFESEVQDGKNISTIKCPFCESVILLPATADILEHEFSLPLMMQNKGRESNPEKELISYYWYVARMYTFQNVGFSVTIGTIKYLTCAECDAGPIGYHDLANGGSYVALTRVKHL